jgi:hypothetical protein
MVSLQELRKHKFFGLAIFDLTITFIFSFIIHSLLWFYPLDMKEKNERTTFQYLSSFVLIVITFVGVGVITHRIFGVKSTLSGYLGLASLKN